MSFALSCIGKWLLVPVTAVGFIVFVIVAALTLTVAICAPFWLCEKLHEKLKTRFVLYSEFSSKVGAKFYSVATERALIVSLALLVLFGVSLLSYPQVLGKNGWFPCDECLPESWQSACAADREAAEAKDRAAFERMCATWEWTECKAVVP